MRVLLDLMRKNGAAVRRIAHVCEELLGHAMAHLKVPRPYTLHPTPCTLHPAPSKVLLFFFISLEPRVE